MLKKLQIFILLVIVLLSLLISLSYSQSKQSSDRSVTGTSDSFSKPPLKSGQWVLYEINISQIPSLNKSAKNNTYLLKTSIVGSEIIDGESYYWEEISLVSEGLTIKSLKKPASRKTKRIIFQRAGFPAMEIDKSEISRQLNILPQLIIPEIMQGLSITNTRNASLSGVVITPTKVTYVLPITKDEIVCRELNYNNPGKGGQLIIWVCEHIPLTGFTKLSYLSKDSIISIKLVKFGFRETVSAISGKVLKFGEVYK